MIKLRNLKMLCYRAIKQAYQDRINNEPRYSQFFVYDGDSTNVLNNLYVGYNYPDQDLLVRYQVIYSLKKLSQSSDTRKSTEFWSLDLTLQDTGELKADKTIDSTDNTDMLFDILSDCYRFLHSHFKQANDELYFNTIIDPANPPPPSTHDPTQIYNQFINIAVINRQLMRPNLKRLNKIWSISTSVELTITEPNTSNIPKQYPY
jgi:hypothetical protein